ncbi:hypothetical protein EKH57_15950 [Halorubrum sp. BOL3-1]|uniref:DUF6498-containing protein n=1 Tax=Halorubrum sp. BOL3-1 TaxID=2497325 RepID=UPI001004FCF1|nr:DUF6498-containing protein [Halorubrum sp. BOL3-1]QAU14070.1 hypothetical protein EKH57_15950 [Halorubrum sp. BOL3-1]
MTESRWEQIKQTIPGALTESREFVAGLVLNFVLILGVIVFQWNLVEIVVIYVIEVAVISFLFLSVALFTPQPVADRNEDVWKREPIPLQPISSLPPVYWRNVKFVGNKAIFTISLFVMMGLIVRDRIFELVSTLHLSVGVVIAGIVLFQLRRVWRHFIADESYRQKSPKDAIQFAFAPVTELLFMILFVIVPVTFVVVGTAIVMDTEFTSRLVLLLYLVPMGVIRAWFGSLDPQTDDLEISFN